MAALDPELDVAVAAMIAEDARFIVIGGFAVIANRFVRATEDIDFLAPDDIDNDRRVLAALVTLDGVRLRDDAPLTDQHSSASPTVRKIATTSKGSPRFTASCRSSPSRGWIHSPRRSSIDRFCCSAIS